VVFGQPLGRANAVDPADLVETAFGGDGLPVPDALRDPGGHSTVGKRLVVEVRSAA